MPSHEEWGYLFFPSPPEWTLIIGAYRWATASLRCARCRWHWFGGDSEPTCCKVSEWSLWAGPSNQGVVQEIEDRAASQSLSLLSRLLFEDWWFFKLHWAWPFYISAHVCRGLFRLSVLAYQSPLFFIFIKEQNGNFLKNPNSCTSPPVVFWRSCVESWCDILDFLFSFFLLRLWTSSISFYYLEVAVTAVLFLSSKFLFFTFMAAYCGLLRGVQPCSFYLLPEPCFMLCGQLAKTTERLCATAQQESS